MTTYTILLILLSVIISGIVTYYQYYYKNNNKSKTTLFLAIIRFVSIFLLFLLIINPVFSSKTLETTKIPLALVVDNSRSIKELKADQQVNDIFKKISENSALKNKFEIQKFNFDEDFYAAKSLDFKGNQSNLDNVGSNLKQLNKNTVYPILLLTDGNQTIGNDYVYGFQESAKVYPIILGDTTTTFDLKINQLNVNKYAFLKNKFPVEVFLQYNGNKSINANFSIQKGGSKLVSQSINFDKKNKVQSFQFLIEADKIGIQKYVAKISSNIVEKNVYNNTKNFAVEIIDQRKEIALITDINHPDLGALKRAIETNAQRKVSIVKPQELADLSKYNVLVLYQPNNTFKKIFEWNKNANLNTFIIAGLTTDYSLLNQIQNDIDFKLTNQKEDYIANYQLGFNLFAQQDINFSQLPPLQFPFGRINLQSNFSRLLNANVANVDSGNPMLVFSEKGARRSAYLFGEGIWKWRMESYLAKQSFEDFDLFADKIIQFLSTNSVKKSLLVEHESFYNSGETIEINAQFFNKNYELDQDAILAINLKNKSSNTTKNYNFSKTNTGNKVTFDGLSPGNYFFQVKEANTGSVYNGSFEVLDFDIEKQFVNPDKERLAQLASQNNSELIYPNKVDSLIEKLLDKNVYLPVEKEIIKNKPLIDWIFILILLAVSLATEWFVRKYNGLL